MSRIKSLVAEAAQTKLASELIKLDAALLYQLVHGAGKTKQNAATRFFNEESAIAIA